jgi:hypothetical protein
MREASERKELRLRYDGRCRSCSGQVRRGERALYEKSTRSVVCLPCGLISDALPIVPAVGTAGRSARRTHQRRRAAQDERARRVFGRLGVPISRLVGEPQHTRAWRKGAKGEELVGKRLERLLEGSGVLLLHDRLIPRSQANIDHLAVGPGGVTVIDAKNYKGEVRVERRGGLLSARREELRINGRRRTRLVEGVQGQVEVVHKALAAARLGHVNVQGALCFANPDGLPLFRKQYMAGILIDGSRSAAKLARRSGELTGERVEAIHRELAVRLPPA